MKLVAIFVLVASLLSLAAAGIMPDAAITSTTNTSIAVQHAANTSDTVQHASGGPSNKEPPTGSTEGGFNITVVDDPYFPSGSEIHCSGHPFPVMTYLGQTAHDMGLWCKTHRLPSLHWEIWWYRGSQSYVCNYAKNTNRCAEDEFWKANAMFDKICGRNGAYIWIPEWAKVIGRDPNDWVSYTPECTNMGW